MDSIVNLPRHIKICGSAFVMAALVAALLLVGTGIGPAQAQDSGNAYANPKPCGPGPGTNTAFMEEPHEVTEGHYALFDAYWEVTQRPTEDEPNKPYEGIMHTNECPPKMTRTVTTETDPDTGEETEKVTYTRSASSIDTKEAIIHVKDVHQVAVVAMNDDVTDDQLSLEEYPKVRVALGLGASDPVPDGTKVWWLRLDDLDTDADETSDLSVGFSTALFDDKYWLGNDNEAPMRWMLETARYRNVDHAEAPHFFAYEDPKIRRGDSKRRGPVLDSTDVDVEEHDMMMDPGEYRALQWIFTKKGSYTISAHLQGFVRGEEYKPSDAGEDWEPISSKYDETSEIKEYVFQVGDKLDETEPPMFGVSRNVHEDAAAGAHVGEPIRVFGAEVPGLTYTLSGDDRDKFSVTSRTHPDAAQVVVAANADFDYDAKSSYDLVLNVSDGKDHEGNNDSSVDHSIAVEIDVIQDPRLFMIASNHTPKVGQIVTLRVNIWALPEGVANSDLSYTILEKSNTGRLVGAAFPVLDEDSSGGTATISQDSAVTYKYIPTATYTLNGVEHTLHGDPMTITWHNDG